MALTSLYLSRRARCRPSCSYLGSLPGAISRRSFGKPGLVYISPKYQAKVESAAQEWQVKARAIKSGKQKHVLDEFGERGFVKQTVG